MKKLLSVLSILFVFTSCDTVKEYEKAQINDAEMKLSARTAEQYETTFQAYREGASGANGGKSGGGCGCN
jgi:thioredoxin-related protein